jgi:ubiquinone biosynthesis protein
MTLGSAWHFWRACEIGLLSLRHGGHFALRAGLWLVARRGPAPPVLLGHTLADLFESLGATFVKLGQVLSARPDLVSPALAGPLARLQSDVAPFDSRRVPGILRRAFGRPMEEIFADFDPVPVASASIAHVHRARLRDGRQVAVKIRRPGVERRVESDLRLLRGAARALSRLPGMRTMPLSELVDELAAPIRQQLDLAREAENVRRFRGNFAAVDHIRIPAPVDGLCVGSVLVMEFLDRLEAVSSTAFTAAERRTAATAGLRALYKMIFTDAFVHADMHPGNVFLRAHGELVLLDMGLIAELSPEDHRAFVDFFFGLVTNDGPACARILQETATYRARHYDPGAFEADIVRLIDRYSALRARDFEVARFVYELMETQRRHGLRGSTRFIMAILSLVVFDGICKQLDPDCDFQAEALGFLLVARFRRAS